MRGVSVNPTSLTIAAGVSGTYRVRLNTEPTDAVDIEVDSPREDVTVTGSPLVFTPQKLEQGADRDRDRDRRRR